MYQNSGYPQQGYPQQGQPQQGYPQQGMMQGIPQMGAMPQPQQQQSFYTPPQIPQLTPEQQQRFAAIDTDRSGKLTPDEVVRCFGQVRFSAQAAKFLLQGVSELPYVDMNTFAQFDFYVNCFFGAFQRAAVGQQRAHPQAVLQALQQLQFNLPPQTLQTVIQKFDETRTGLDFGDFMKCCSYLLICNRLMAKFDQQRRGLINLDSNGLANLGLWFL